MTQSCPIDVETLIPHRDRMKLIDQILELSDETAVSSAQISDRWPLSQGSFVHPIVLIEIVAQTAGCHISWKRGSGRGGGLGWIVGIKSADFSVDRIPHGTELITTVKNLYSAENYHVLEGTVRAGADILGLIQLQVFHSESY